MTKKKDSRKKVMRLAHKILLKTIGPAKLQLEEAVDVAILLIKALVLSNTEDDDPDDRAELIAWVEERFIEAMFDLNPNAERAHAWLVAPQGLITEPVGFLWAGSADDRVEVLIGMELDALRAELSSKEEETRVIVTEGVEGIALTDPDWDGESTIACANPTCRNRHDVHLLVAESLFQQAKQQQQQRLASPPN